MDGSGLRVFAFHYRDVGDSVGSDLGLGKSGGQAKLRSKDQIPEIGVKIKMAEDEELILASSSLSRAS